MFLKYQDEIARGAAMLGTGLAGWLVQNAAALDIVAKLAIAAVTIVSILIQLALAVHKHFQKDDKDGQ